MKESLDNRFTKKEDAIAIAEYKNLFVKDGEPKWVFKQCKNKKWKVYRQDDDISSDN